MTSRLSLTLSIVCLMGSALPVVAQTGPREESNRNPHLRIDSPRLHVVVIEIDIERREMPRAISRRGYPAGFYLRSKRPARRTESSSLAISAMVMSSM